MSENMPMTVDLSLSVARRVSHLWPTLQFLWEVLAEAKKASEKTKRQYRNADDRMRRHNLLPEQIGSNSRRSYNFYRSALVFCSIEQIASLYDDLSDHGAKMSARHAHHLVNLIEMKLMLLTEYPPHAKGRECKWRPPAGGVVKKGKRRNLTTLPSDWRLRLARACPVSSKYFLPLLILTLTGLRPEELRKGVRVTMPNAYQLTVTIHGAKVTAIAGQRTRRLQFAIDNPIIRHLSQIVSKSDSSEGLVVSIHSPGALCNFLRRLSRRIFRRHKYTASPYSYRHAFAADRKFEGVVPEDLGAMLGHAVDRSQQSYGARGQGQPLSTITGFSATRKVRAVPKSVSAKNWAADKFSLATVYELAQMPPSTAQAAASSI